MKVDISLYFIFQIDYCVNVIIISIANKICVFKFITAILGTYVHTTIQKYILYKNIFNLDNINVNVLFKLFEIFSINL